MFDIGWPELMVVAVLTVLVVGPKELPRVLRTVTGIIRKIRMMAGEFQGSIDDLAREADLQDIKKEMMDANSKDIGAELEKAVDPTGEVTGSIKEIQGDLNESKSAFERLQESKPATDAAADAITGANAAPAETDSAAADTAEAEPAVEKKADNA